MKSLNEFCTRDKVVQRSFRKVGNDLWVWIFAILGILFLRQILLYFLCPDGSVLEHLALMVRTKQMPVGEAVVTFCREMLIDASA